MKNNNFLKTNSTLLIILAAILILSIFGWSTMGNAPFVRTMFSGLTLGALYFMVAAGLTLIFGLMDVLNFAHGTMFMIGAYAGWQFYTNPTFLFGIAPLVCALLTGLALGEPLKPYIIAWKIPEKWQQALRSVLILLAIGIGVAGILGLNLIKLAETAMVATMTMSNPLAEATSQEPLAVFWFRPLLLFLAGALLAVANDRPGDNTQVVPKTSFAKTWFMPGLIALAAIILTLVRESGPVAVLLMNADVRFFLSLAAGVLVGAGLGAVIEITLIRPLYGRPFYQVLITLGLAYVLLEIVRVLWSPLAYQMSRPPLFSQPDEAPSLWAWFSTHNVTINIFDVTIPSYRLFIILLGIVMLIALGLLMKSSRLGMIIRAGVQDRQMVEALGINVRKVFTTVFMLGAGLAALGGIGASPYMPLSPDMGDAFQLTAFITVVIGGMGSYSGAAIGALLLGLARAFGDYLALQFKLSSSIPEASTVIIMILVLLLRPAGLFGKKD